MGLGEYLIKKLAIEFDFTKAIEGTSAEGTIELLLRSLCSRCVHMVHAANLMSGGSDSGMVVNPLVRQSFMLALGVLEWDSGAQHERGEEAH